MLQITWLDSPGLFLLFLYSESSQKLEVYVEAWE